MRIPQLDERLQAAMELFEPCEYGADIGADHGHLSCALLHSNKCAGMIVSDISADSLHKARHLFEMHGLIERTDIRVADGFSALREGEKVTCAALCGIGGQLMARLLKHADLAVLPEALVLSANTDIPLVRKTLSDIGYHIAQERIVCAKRRFYIVLRAERGDVIYTDKEQYLGPVLLRERPALWESYLKWREGVVACEVGHEQQLEWIREALVHVQGNC